MNAKSLRTECGVLLPRGSSDYWADGRNSGHRAAAKGQEIQACVV